MFRALLMLGFLLITPVCNANDAYVTITWVDDQTGLFSKLHVRDGESLYIEHIPIGNPNWSVVPTWSTAPAPDEKIDQLIEDLAALGLTELIDEDYPADDIRCRGRVMWILHSFLSGQYHNVNGACRDKDSVLKALELIRSFADFNQTD